MHRLKKVVAISNIPNLYVAAPNTPRVQALANSDLNNIAVCQMSSNLWQQQKEEAESLV